MSKESSPKKEESENKEELTEEGNAEQKETVDSETSDQTRSESQSQNDETSVETAEESDVEGKSAADKEAEENQTETEEETPEQMEARYKKELAGKDDKYIRLVAEFENFKKRTSQEMQTRFKFANQSFALNIITGLDNLERALVQAKDEENEQVKEFIRGIEMVQQQLYEALKQNNIERVFPKGEPFDPNKHEAMGVIETEEVEPDHIAEVFQAGYILHDRVIRPAMVQVAKKK